MVDFGATQFEGGIVPETVEQAPVVDQSGEVMARGLQNPLATIASAAGSIFNSMQQNQNDLITANFSQSLSSLAEAVEQGAISGAAARTRARALYSQTIADNPSMASDLTQLYTTLTGGRIAGYVDSGSEIEQAHIERQQAAIRAGFPDMQSYDLFQSAANNLAHVDNVYGLNEAYRNENEAQYQYDTTQALRGVARTSIPWVNNRINLAMQELQNGVDPAEVIASLRSDYTAESASILGIAQDVDAEWVLDPINRIIENFEQMATGAITTEVYEAQIARDQAVFELSMRADPEIGPILQTMDIVGENFPSLQQQLFGPVVGKLGRMLEGRATDLLDGTESASVTLQMFQGQINEFLVSDQTDAQRSQLANQLNGFLNSARNTGDLQGPQGLRDYMGVLSSEQFYELTNILGGIPSSSVAPVENAIREYYEGPLLEAVAQRWDGVNIALGQNVQSDALVGGQDEAIPTGTPNSALDVIWSGDGVRFVPKPGYENNLGVRSAAEGLNNGSNSIAGPLNTLIRAQAHIAGHNNYQQIWENNFAGRLFGIGEETTSDRVNQMLDSTGSVGNSETATALQALEPFTSGIEQNVVGTSGNWYVDPQQGRDTLASMSNPQNLTLADFNDDFQRINDIVTSTFAEDPQRLINATTPLEVASAYLGLSEDRDMDNITLSRFIRQATGMSINPATTAWCAAFVDAVLHQSGQGGGTGRLNARSYLNWGQSVDNPQRGDIVVLWRGDPNGWQGHVGFFEGYDSNGNIRILGGNQSNQVSVETYPTTQLLGFRRAA